MAATLLLIHHLVVEKTVDYMIWSPPNVMNGGEWLNDHIRPYCCFPSAQWSRLCSLYLRLCIFVLWLCLFGYKQFPNAATANKRWLCFVQRADFCCCCWDYATEVSLSVRRTVVSAPVCLVLDAVVTFKTLRSAHSSLFHHICPRLTHSLSELF